MIVNLGGFRKKGGVVAKYSFKASNSKQIIVLCDGRDIHYSLNGALQSSTTLTESNTLEF